MRSPLVVLLYLNRPRHRARLLIDATSTVRIDHKSGIQRVVKKICAALAERAPDTSVERMFVFRDDSRGWFAVDGRTLDQPQKDEQKTFGCCAAIHCLCWIAHGSFMIYIGRTGAPVV